VAGKVGRLANKPQGIEIDRLYKILVMHPSDIWLSVASPERVFFIRFTPARGLFMGK
jgi:hypothetical protein